MPVLDTASALVLKIGSPQVLRDSIGSALGWMDGWMDLGLAGKGQALCFP